MQAELEESIERLAKRLKESGSDGGSTNALRLNLCEKCLRLFISEGGQALPKEAVAGKLYQKSLAEYKSFDSLIFMESFRYAAGVFDADKGAFLHLLRRVYYTRRDAGARKAYYDRRMAGMRQIYSETEKQLMRDLGKIAGRRFEELSEAELADLSGTLSLSAAALRELQERGSMVSASLEEMREGRDFELYSASAQKETEQECWESQEEIRQIFQAALQRASKKQRPYFYCFITLEIRRLYGKNIPQSFAACLDDKFFEYLEGGQLLDSGIAAYLQTDKSNVSKYRTKFQKILTETMKY